MFNEKHDVKLRVDGERQLVSRLACSFNYFGTVPILTKIASLEPVRLNRHSAKIRNRSKEGIIAHKMRTIMKNNPISPGLYHSHQHSMTLAVLLEGVVQELDENRFVAFVLVL